MKCPRCQGENNAQARFCVHCGLQFGAAAQGGGFCTKCGAALPAGVRFCTSCGTPVGNLPVREPVLEEDDTEGTMVLEEDDTEGTMVLEEDDTEGTIILDDTPESFTGSPVNNTTVAGGSVYDTQMPFTANQFDETTMLNDQNTYMPNHAGQTPDNGFMNGTPDNGSANGYISKTPNNSFANGNAGENTVQGGYSPVSPAQRDNPPGKSGENGAVKAVIAVLCVLIAAAAVVLVLVWKGIIQLPFELPFLTPKTEVATEISEPKLETEAEGFKSLDEADKPAETDEPSGMDAASGVSEEQFADADAVLSAGKDKIENIAELMDGMNDIRSAMEQYQSLAAEYGMSEIVSDHMGDAFDAYVSSIIKHKDLMAEQELSGGIYAQIMGEFEQAKTSAEELAAAGFTVDTSLLESEMDGFDASYRTRILKTFNEFTSRESWSRTEAWNLMDDMDYLFDSEDLDDPIRLRYCYALAWWTQRQCETELSAGTITSKGAAIKIAGILEAADYNLMLIDLYIQYMRAENQDCSAVEDAYNEILNRLEETQGIRIGEDVDIAHFWYFNDFGEYSVDDKNGVTAENRQWIRDRMSSVEF